MEITEHKRTDTNRTDRQAAVAKPTDSSINTTVPTMATVSSNSAPATVSMDIWHGAEAKSVTSERKVTPELNAIYWNNFYKAIGLASADESKKRRARASAYQYCAVNGTSRAGEYANKVTTADGITYRASDIANACNVRDIRKWMRANDDEAVDFFHATGVLEKQDLLVKHAREHGYSAEAVVGVVDFISDSTKLTVTESRLNKISFNVSIQRSRGAREGKSLETVEQEDVERGLDAQNGAVERGDILRM